MPPTQDCALPDIGQGERRCYVTLERAGTRDGSDWQDATGLLREMMIQDQELINTARNFLGVAETCALELGENVAPYHITAPKLRKLGEAGHALHDGGREIGATPTITHPSMLSFIGEGSGVGRLEEVNRRCSEPPDPWCGRTGVYRPRLEELRATVAAHMLIARDVDGRGGAQGYDGIRSWAKDACR